MSVDAYTVAHPGTVMVHAHDTLTTYGAVMSARCLYRLASLAVAESDVVTHISHELRVYQLLRI